jgi:hypothetical protein
VVYSKREREARKLTCWRRLPSARTGVKFTVVIRIPLARQSPIAIARTALFVGVSYAVRRLFGRRFAGWDYSDGIVKSGEVGMPADESSGQPLRLRLSHRVIVRAPRQIPMFYRPNELAKGLGMCPLIDADWVKAAAAICSSLAC